jgi:hypothetical protein
LPEIIGGVHFLYLIDLFLPGIDFPDTKKIARALGIDMKIIRSLFKTEFLINTQEAAPIIPAI